MGKTLWLVAILILLITPSALALDCTKYRGDEKKLCNVIKYLPLTERYKRALMKDDLYRIEPSNQADNLNLNLDSLKEVTFDEIYETKIVLIIKITFFIFLLYFFYKTLSYFRRQYG